MRKTYIKFLFFICLFVGIFAFLYMFAPTVVYAAETAENGEIAADTTSSIIEWLKSLNMDEIRNYLVALAAKAGIDTALIISTIIYIVRAKIKEAKQSKYYQELFTKLNAEHQKRLEETTAAYDAKLEALQNTIVTNIRQQNSERREEAKATVDQAKAALSEIKVSLDE